MLPASGPGKGRGLVALTLGAALAVAAACGGNGDGGEDGTTAAPTPLGPCGTALAPLTDEALTPVRFEEANAGLEEAIEQAEQGAPQEALVAFFLLSHDFTHDVDGPLREQDEGLAVRLCNAVVEMEELVTGEADGDADGDTVSELARSVQEALAEAREALAAGENPS